MSSCPNSFILLLPLVSFINRNNKRSSCSYYTSPSPLPPLSRVPRLEQPTKLTRFCTCRAARCAPKKCIAYQVNCNKWAQHAEWESGRERERQGECESGTNEQLCKCLFIWPCDRRLNPTESHVAPLQHNFVNIFWQKFKTLSNRIAQRGQNNLNVFAMRPNKMPIVRNSTLITSDCELLLQSLFVVALGTDKRTSQSNWHKTAAATCNCSQLWGRGKRSGAGQSG